MHNDNDDDPVGYGKPPTWTRFRKGKSGNPKGRPKRRREKPVAGPSEADDYLRAELQRPIRVTDASGSKDLKMLKLLIRAQAQSAAKGNPIAQRDILKQVRELEVRDAERARAAKEEARLLYQSIVRWKARRTKLWRIADQQGCEPEAPWPHPDDMFLFPETQGWRIRGPSDDHSVPFYRYIRHCRDFYYYDLHLSEADKTGTLGFDVKLACLMWIFYDQMLPLRWQITPQLDEALWTTASWREAKIIALRDEARAEMDRYEALHPIADKDAYHEVNAVMKPALKRAGFRSLAHFQASHPELECAAFGKNGRAPLAVKRKKD